MINFYDSELGQAICSWRSISVEPLIEHIKDVFKIDPLPVRGYQKAAAISTYDYPTTLQATLWLTEPISQHPNLTRYGMILHLPSSFFTSEYTAYIEKDNHGTWTSYLKEYEPTLSQERGNRTLNVEHNYRGYGNNSVTLSVNLGSIGYPSTYSLRFYTVYKNMTLVDITSPTFTIPPHLNILHMRLPSYPYHMIAGDDAPIPIQLNSTDLPPGTLHVWDPGNRSVNLTFDRNQIPSPLSGTILKMQIKGTQNLDPGIHIIAVNKTYQDLGLQYIPSLSSTVHFPIQILPKTPLDSVLISLKNNEGYARYCRSYNCNSNNNNSICPSRILHAS